MCKVFTNIWANFFMCSTIQITHAGWGVYTALTFAVCVIITGLTYLMRLPELRDWAITSTVGVMYDDIMC